VVTDLLERTKNKTMKPMKLIAKTNPVALGGMPATTLETAENADHAGMKSERLFVGIVEGSLALAFGFAFASLQSFDLSDAGFAFRFSSGTFLAFLVGGLVGLIYGRILSVGLRGGASSQIRVATFLLLLGGAGGFLYPLRFISRERLVELLQGLATVAVALSVVGYMLWRIKGFLENDEARTENAAREHVTGPRANR
jgi:hypothetical protein